MTRRPNGLNQYLAWKNDLDPSDHHYWDGRIRHDDNATSPPSAGNGVMVEDGSITATYNALNQPIAIWDPYSALGSSNFLWFGYDPLGRCVKRWIGPDTENAPNSNPATYYYYDGWNLVQEGTTESPVTFTYVHGGRVDEIVASQLNGQWAYHYYDARGHCIMLTDNDGALLEQYEYDAFGFPRCFNSSNQQIARQSARTRFLFTGREYLSDLRIYDYRARLYHPELGRFLQPDPKQFEAGDYNLYRYCHNDPVNRVDPTGLTDWGQVGYGTLGVIGGIAATATAIAVTPTGFGTWAAPFFALEAAAGFSYGVGNIVAGFADNASNHAQTQKMLNSPGNVGGAIGRVAGMAAGDKDGGQQKQDIGSLLDNVANIGAGAAGAPSSINPATVLPWLGGQVTSTLGATQDGMKLIDPPLPGPDESKASK